jgi:hypothetical protein
MMSNTIMSNFMITVALIGSIGGLVLWLAKEDYENSTKAFSATVILLWLIIIFC